MKIIDKFKNLISGRVSGGRDTLDDIARRIARDKVDDRDVSRLDKALSDIAASVNAEDVERRVDIVKRYDAAVATATQLNAAQQELTAAEDRETTAAKEWAAQCRKREAQAFELADARRERAQQVQACINAMSVQHELELEHHELLEVDQVDLDACTLVWNGTVINTSDPLAPQRFVPQDVFKRELSRRRRIVHHALHEALAVHRDAVEAWGATLAREHSGRLIDNGKMPRLSGTTWREIVAGGRLAEFDRPIPGEQPASVLG